jgi:hypothetical protein
VTETQACETACTKKWAEVAPPSYNRLGRTGGHGGRGGEKKGQRPRHLRIGCWDRRGRTTCTQGQGARQDMHGWRGSGVRGQAQSAGHRGAGLRRGRDVALTRCVRCEEGSGIARQRGAARGSSRLWPTTTRPGQTGPPSPTARPSADTGWPAAGPFTQRPTAGTRFRAWILKHVNRPI